MIYVDAPVFMKPNGRKKYAHMVADTLEELHAFADKIGLRREWVQIKGKILPHYDLTPNKRQQALAAGAVEIDREQFAAMLHADIQTWAAVVKSSGATAD